MSLEPKEEPTRLERYLTHILDNPDKWIHISRREKKGILYSTNESHNERVELVRDLKTALDLMGIEYQMKKNSSYIIRTMVKFARNPGVMKYDPAGRSFTIHDSVGVPRIIVGEF